MFGLSTELRTNVSSVSPSSFGIIWIRVKVMKSKFLAMPMRIRVACEQAPKVRQRECRAERSEPSVVWGPFLPSLPPGELDFSVRSVPRSQARIRVVRYGQLFFREIT